MKTMGFPWTTLLRWLLPSIPEIVTTVRSMKKDQQAPAQEPLHTVRLEQLERALQQQELLINDLASRLDSIRKRLQITILAAILGLIVSLVAIGIAVFR
jgi:hypothetical protein